MAVSQHRRNTNYGNSDSSVAEHLVCLEVLNSLQDDDYDDGQSASVLG